MIAPHTSSVLSFVVIDSDDDCLESTRRFQRRLSRDKKLRFLRKKEKSRNNPVECKELEQKDPHANKPQAPLLARHELPRHVIIAIAKKRLDGVRVDYKRRRSVHRDSHIVKLAKIRQKRAEKKNKKQLPIAA